jgi:hypothetical protein
MLNSTTSFTPDRRRAPFTYSQSGRVLICTLCPAAVMCDLEKIRSYLYYKHKLLVKERTALLSDFTLPENYVYVKSDLQSLANGSLIELTLPIIKGFVYTHPLYPF